MTGAADLTARLNLRNRNRRRSRLRRLAIAALALAVLVGLGWLVGFSRVLDVREIAVSGNELTTSEQILTAAQVGLGTPLARIPANEIRQRVLALPAIAAVKLHRNWPNTLLIEVTERQLVYQRLSEGQYHWVDVEGRIFHVLPERSPGVVAVVAGDDQRFLADVATVVAALPADVVELVGHLEATTLDHIVVLLVDGRSIVWGSAEKSTEKAALLASLLAMPGTVIDVSVPSHPAIK